MMSKECLTLLCLFLYFQFLRHFFTHAKQYCCVVLFVVMTMPNFITETVFYTHHASDVKPSLCTNATAQKMYAGMFRHMLGGSDGTMEFSIDRAPAPDNVSICNTMVTPLYLSTDHFYRLIIKLIICQIALLYWLHMPCPCYLYRKYR
jgi:hypothetical protein